MFVESLPKQFVCAGDSGKDKYKLSLTVGDF